MHVKDPVVRVSSMDYGNTLLKEVDHLKSKTRQHLANHEVWNSL